VGSHTNKKDLDVIWQMAFEPVLMIMYFSLMKHVAFE